MRLPRASLARQWTSTGLYRIILQYYHYSQYSPPAFPCPRQVSAIVAALKLLLVAMERGGEWLAAHAPGAAPRLREMITELDDALQQQPAALRAKLTETLLGLYTELKADASRPVLDACSHVYIVVLLSAEVALL